MLRYCPGLEDTARYAPEEGFDLGQGFFCPSSKTRAFYAGFAYFRYFWCLAVTSVTFSSNLSNFEKNSEKKT